jgi:hypothetical protein
MKRSLVNLLKKGELHLHLESPRGPRKDAGPRLCYLPISCAFLVDRHRHLHLRHLQRKWIATKRWPVCCKTNSLRKNWPKIRTLRIWHEDGHAIESPRRAAGDQPNIMGKISELGDNAKRRLQTLAAQFNANANRNNPSQGGQSDTANVAAAERRGLLDNDHDDMELAARKDL